MADNTPLRNSFAMVAVAIIKLVTATVGTVIVALIVQTLVGTKTSTTLFLLLAAIVIIRIIFVIVEWRTTTYVLGASEIEYRVGKINVSLQRIPYDTIHGVQQDTPWILRLFRRSELRIDSSARDNTTQVHFTALTDDAATQIIERVRHAHSDSSSELTVSIDDAPPPSPKHSQQASIGFYSVVRGRYFIAVLLAIAGLGFLAQLTNTDYFGALEMLSQWLLQQDLAAQTAIVFGTIIIAITVGIGSRMLSMMNLQHVFTSTRLETRQGFISTRTRSIARNDVTLVELRQPLLYRLSGRVMVFVSSGSGKGDPALDLAPNIPIDQADTTIQYAFPRYGSLAKTPVTTSRRYFLAVIALSFIVTASAATLAWWLGQPWAHIAALLTLLIVLVRLSRTRSTISLNPGATYVEVGRSWIAHHRWVFPATAILHCETVQGLAGTHFPHNRLHFVVADRGTRTFTIRGLNHTQITELYGVLTSPGLQIGAYSYVRNNPAPDDTIEG